jgi:hypothetical protein
MKQMPQMKKQGSILKPPKEDHLTSADFTTPNPRQEKSESFEPLNQVLLKTHEFWAELCKFDQEIEKSIE